MWREEKIEDTAAAKEKEKPIRAIRAAHIQVTQITQILCAKGEKKDTNSAKCVQEDWKTKIVLLIA